MILVIEKSQKYKQDFKKKSMFYRTNFIQTKFEVSLGGLFNYFKAVLYNTFDINILCTNVDNKYQKYWIGQCHLSFEGENN